MFFAGTASSTYLLASASIAVSVHARRPNEAVTMTYLGALGWMFGPSIIAGVLARRGGVLGNLVRVLSSHSTAGSGRAARFSSSTANRFLMGPSSFAEPVFWMIGTQLVYGHPARLPWRSRAAPTRQPHRGEHGGAVLTDPGREGEAVPAAPGLRRRRDLVEGAVRLADQPRGEDRRGIDVRRRARVCSGTSRTSSPSRPSGSCSLRATPTPSNRSPVQQLNAYLR